MAANRCQMGVWFLACIVEVVGRQGTAHAGGSAAYRTFEVGLEVGLHLVAGLKNNVALRQGLLGQRSLGDNAVLLAEAAVPSRSEFAASTLAA